MTILSKKETDLIDNYIIKNVSEFNLKNFNTAIVNTLPWRRVIELTANGELGEPITSPAYLEYTTTLIERNKLMQKLIQPMNEMSKQIIIDLQQELINAYENRECFVIGHDTNMIKLWDEQIDYIIRELQYLGHYE